MLVGHDYQLMPRDLDTELYALFAALDREMDRQHAAELAADPLCDERIVAHVLLEMTMQTNSTQSPMPYSIETLCATIRGYLPPDLAEQIHVRHRVVCEDGLAQYVIATGECMTTPFLMGAHVRRDDRALPLIEAALWIITELRPRATDVRTALLAAGALAAWHALQGPLQKLIDPGIDHQARGDSEPEPDGCDTCGRAGCSAWQELRDIESSLPAPDGGPLVADQVIALGERPGLAGRWARRTIRRGARAYLLSIDPDVACLAQGSLMFRGSGPWATCRKFYVSRA